MNTATTKLCSRCGAQLILISSVTQRVEGSLFPQTTSVYHCSVESCQKEKDHETQKRLKLLKDKAAQEQVRATERQLKRQVAMTQKRT